MPKLHTRIYPPKKSCTAKTSMMIHKASQEPRKKPLAIAYKLSAAVYYVKVMKYRLCKLRSRAQATPRLDFFFLYRVKNCAIEIACIDSPHIVIYTTHASSTAHCYTLARRRRNDGSNSSAAASPSQHSPKRPSHGHQRRSAGGAAHRL